MQKPLGFYSPILFDTAYHDYLQAFAERLAFPCIKHIYSWFLIYFGKSYFILLIPFNFFIVQVDFN